MAEARTRLMPREEFRVWRLDHVSRRSAVVVAFSALDVVLPLKALYERAELPA